MPIFMPEETATAWARGAWLALFALLFGCSAVPSSQTVVRGNGKHIGDGRFVFSAGKSDLDSDQTFPIAQENVFGITFQGIRSENSSIGLETGYFYRYGSNDHVVVPGRGTFDYDHNVDEVFAGLWAPFDIGWGLHPYVGAGGEWLGIKAHEQGAFTSATDRDMGWGGYVHAGLMIDVVDHVQIGVDLRAEFTNHLGLFGEHAYGDFRQAAVVIGIGI